MIQKIKKKLIILASALTLLAPVVITSPAYAQAVDCSKTPNADACKVQTGIEQSLKCGSNAELKTDPSCATVTTGDPSSLSGKIRSILNVLSAVVGVVAVIMIIYGGFRYVASGGKQESVTAAKNTLLYAIVGLIIVALAQAIVHFVLKSAT